jgi:hypothetical protein
MHTITVCVSYRRGTQVKIETISASGTNEEAVTTTITKSIPKKGWRVTHVEVTVNTFKEVK